MLALVVSLEIAETIASLLTYFSLIKDGFLKYIFFGSSYKKYNYLNCSLFY